MARKKKGLAPGHIILIVLAVVGFGYLAFTQMNKDKLVVGVLDFPAYVAGPYFNGGYAANTDGVVSRFQEQYGMEVEFKVMSDPAVSSEALTSGEIDIVWGTIDSYPTEAYGMQQYGVKAFMPISWSRGADNIIGGKEINTFNDLRGKKIAYTPKYPSHTLLLHALHAAGLSEKDIELVETDGPEQAAQAFIDGKVAAAVTVAPYHKRAINDEQGVEGAHVLTSTKEATHIIVDAFYATESRIAAKRKLFVKFMEGWYTAVAEIQASDDNRYKAEELMSTATGMEQEFCTTKGVRLFTAGDALRFMGAGGSSEKGEVTGRSMYVDMTKTYIKYTDLGKKDVPTWNKMSDKSLVNELKNSPWYKENKKHQEPEKQKEYKAFKSQSAALEFASTAKTVSTRDFSINFPSGSSLLSAADELEIKNKFISEAISFPGLSIIVEGNTDSQGGNILNQRVSEKRAKSVYTYLVEQGVQAGRIVYIGNGDTKPVGNNATPAGRAQNRRTSIKLVRSGDFEEEELL
jgi:outer membrane protein OmpA-like peptidoglycan-associated protein/ABC-type nitrate/sulfonate/bicarbonate transport system substrate-binding protein